MLATHKWKTRTARDRARTQTRVHPSRSPVFHRTVPAPHVWAPHLLSSRCGHPPDHRAQTPQQAPGARLASSLCPPMAFPPCVWGETAPSSPLLLRTVSGQDGACIRNGQRNMDCVLSGTRSRDFTFRVKASTRASGGDTPRPSQVQMTVNSEASGVLIFPSLSFQKVKTFKMTSTRGHRPLSRPSRCFVGTPCRPVAFAGSHVGPPAQPPKRGH